MFRPQHTRAARETYGVGTDGWRRRAAHPGSMLIRLRINERQPPEGELFLEGRESMEFSGWLDLLRVLSEALEEGTRTPPLTPD